MLCSRPCRFQKTRTMLGHAQRFKHLLQDSNQPVACTLAYSTNKPSRDNWAAPTPAARLPSEAARVYHISRSLLHPLLEHSSQPFVHMSSLTAPVTVLLSPGSVDTGTAGHVSSQVPLSSTSTAGNKTNSNESHYIPCHAMLASRNC